MQFLASLLTNLPYINPIPLAGWLVWIGFAGLMGLALYSWREYQTEWNGLATSYAFGDQIAGSTSARDGILTMLWYVERYLHHARTVYPAAYTFITGNACWRDLILTIWGRDWYYLELTRGMARFGIDDAAIEALVDDPVLLDEIARIRAASSCGGP